MYAGEFQSMRFSCRENGCHASQPPASLEHKCGESYKSSASWQQRHVELVLKEPAEEGCYEGMSEGEAWPILCEHQEPEPSPTCHPALSAHIHASVLTDNGPMHRPAPPAQPSTFWAGQGLVLRLCCSATHSLLDPREMMAAADVHS